MAGIILSGGENRRMGRNKAFLLHRGRLFLWNIIEALSHLFRELILVTREPEWYAGFPVQTVKDLVEDRGPLTGLYTGLTVSSDRKNFLVGCDMPMIRTELVQHMIQISHDVDAVIPAVQYPEKGGAARIEPLHAVYDKGCLPVIEKNLKEGKRSLNQLVRSLNVRYLGKAEMARFDPALDSFRNINTPETYQALTLNPNIP